MSEPELRRPDHRPSEPRGRRGRYDLHPRPAPECPGKPRGAEDLHARQLRGSRSDRLDGRLHRRLPDATRLRSRPLPARALRTGRSGRRDRRALPLRLPQDGQRPDHREPFPDGPGTAEPAGRAASWRKRDMAGMPEWTP
ncbi:MAG: hypothetical protein MZW92_08645 [Comamonadaceae bacterium]|nr:hypothetical protein [Comamonadaceae bacterium]